MTKPERPLTKVLEKVVVKTVEVHISQYHVILLDDNEHSYDYVIEMLGSIFGYSKTEAFELACQVDGKGWVIVDTTHKDRAELKQEQIHSFGTDWRMPGCKGSMSAIIEPADTP